MLPKDSTAFETLAKENQNLAQKLRSWLKELIEDIKKAFAGVEANSAEAKAMLNVMDELQKKWDAALVGAVQNTKQQTAESTDGVQYQARVGTTFDGLPVYETDVDQSLSLDEKKNLYKERIATVINLGGITLKTDTKRITVNADAFTVQKNLYGDTKQRSDAEARLNALYDTADILAGSNYKGKGIEPSFSDPSTPPKNQAHKDVKYWYYFENQIVLDGTVYNVLFNIRDKGKQQYQYLIEFLPQGRATKKQMNYKRDTAANSSFARNGSSSVSGKTVPQTGEEVNRQYSTRATPEQDAENEDIRYSIRPQLKDDLESVLHNTFPASESEVVIGDTSDFLVNTLKADPLAVTMPARKAYANMVSEERARLESRYDDELDYHDLGADGLVEALKESENPVAAFADYPDAKGNERQNRVVLVTNKKINGNYAVVIAELDSTGLINKRRVRVNKDITVFDKKTTGRDILEANAEHRLLFLDKKRSQSILAGVPGTAFPAAIQDLDFEANIQQFWANVKGVKAATSAEVDTETPMAKALREAGLVDDAQYQLRETGLSAREILSSALMDAAETDAERDRLRSYHRAVKQLDETQAQLDDVRSQIHDIMFTKGADRSNLKALEAQKTQLEKKLDWWDKRLMGLQNTKALKAVLERERTRVMRCCKNYLQKYLQFFEYYGNIPRHLQKTMFSLIGMVRCRHVRYERL